MDVIEDLVDEVWIGDVCNDPQLATAEGAEADVYLKDALETFRPSQRRGGRIVAAAA